MSYSSDVQRVEFFLGGKEFPKLDIVSESDPFILVSQRNAKDAKSNFTEIGRTEIITDRSAPEFKKRFVVDYFPDQKQELKFELYDADSETTDIKKSDFIGTTTIALSQIVDAAGKNLQWPVTDAKGKALAKTQLIVKPEVLADEARSVRFQFSAEKLEKMDMMSESDPFVEILRKRKDNTYVVVASTEVVKNNANPSWKALDVAMTTLSADGRDDTPLLLRVSDFNGTGATKLIGECAATLKQLTSQKRFELKNPADKTPKAHGAVNVVKAEVSTDAKLEAANKAVFGQRRTTPSFTPKSNVTSLPADNGPNVMVIVAVLVMLLAAGVGAFFFYQKNRK